MSVEVRLLGPVEVRADGHPVCLTSRPLAVLAMLALAPNWVVGIGRLIDGLWGDAPPRTARESVHYFVHRLRAALQAYAPGMVETHGSDYLLRVDPEQVDTARFARLAEAARAARHAQDLRTAWEVYGQALGVWAGPALLELAGLPFAQPWVTRYEALRLGCVTERVRVGLELGWHDELAGELEGLVAEHPAHEVLRGLLMLALYRSGRQADALDAYTRARQHTVEALGVEPGQDLRGLQRAILAQDPALAPPPTAGRDSRQRHAPTDTAQPNVGATSARTGPSAVPTPARKPARTTEVAAPVGPVRRLVSVLAVELRPPETVTSDPNLSADGPLAEAHRAVARYGGIVVDGLGGRLVAVFGHLRVREDDPERAVRAALELCGLTQTAPGMAHRVRAGVETGQVLVDSGIVGAAQAAAAGLQERAPAGGVLVGPVAYQATSRAISYQPAEPPSAGGRPTGWRAVGPRAQIGLALPGGRPARLVERRQELDLLGYALARLRDHDNPSPQMVTLVGVAGVGKTRMVEELGRLVEADPELVCWRQARCAPEGGHGPGALAQVVMAQAGITPGDPAEQAHAKVEATVAALLGDPAEAGQVTADLAVLVGSSSGAESPTRSDAGLVWAAWARFVEALAAQRPTVLVIEDLHWADATLLDGLAGLVDTVGPVRLLLVVTARPELRAARPRWGGGPSSAATITLAPLTESGSRLLFDHLTAQAGVEVSEGQQARVLAAAGGNPLFLEEYVRGLTQPTPPDQATLPIPATIQQVIAARIDTLPVVQRELLAGIAILGDPVSVGALAAVCGHNPTQVTVGLAALERAELLRRTRTRRGDQPEYLLRHPLIREVADQRLLRAQRAHAHQRAAAWLETRPAQDPGRAEGLAHHLLQAFTLTQQAGRSTKDLAGRARVAARAAGDHALRLGALGAAARWYQHALALWPAEDPQRPGLLLGLGRALAYGQQTGQDVLTQAREACQGAGDQQGVAEAEALLSHLARVGLHPERAAAHTDRALALPASRSPAGVEALTSKAIDALMADQHPQAIRIAGRACGRARQLGLAGQVANAASIAANTRILAGNLDAVVEAEHARDDLDRLGVPVAVYAHFGLTHALWWYGDLDRCGQAVTRAQQAARAAGAAVEVWVAAVEAGLAYASGQWAAAETLTGRVLDDDRAVYLHPWAQVLRGRMHLGRGELEDAHACAKAALARTAGPDPAGGGEVRYWQVAAAFAGRVALARGDHQRARELADPLLVWLHAQPARGCVTPDLVGLLLDLDSQPGAPPLMPPEGLPPTRWHAAVNATLTGDLAAALEHYTVVGSVIDEAAVRIRLARALATAGRQGAAAEHADHAAVVWRKAGATADLSHAEALLSRSQPHPPRHSGPTPHPTPPRRSQMTQQQTNLGAVFDPLGAHLADPYPFYQHARQTQPVFYADRLGAWVLTRYQDVNYALTHTAPAGPVSSANSLQPLAPLCPAAQEQFTRGYPPTPEPITTDGAEHQRLRTPLARMLSRIQVTDYEPYIRATATTLIEGFADHGQVEVMGAYARQLPLQVIAHLFALDPDDLAEVQEGSYDSVAAIASGATDAEQAKAARGMVGLMFLCGRYARQRRLTPGRDLVSRTVAALTPGNQPLTDAQEAECGRLLAGALIAGHVTTSTAIGAGLHALLADRDQWEWLCQHPDSIPDAVEEILRHTSPVQMFRRHLLQPLTLSGVQMAAGEDLLLAYGAANRDPETFPNPERFDLHRPRPAHLTFGAGPHYCLGAHLARAELATTLEVLTQRLPGLRLAAAQQITIQPTLITRGPKTLHLTW